MVQNTSRLPLRGDIVVLPQACVSGWLSSTGLSMENREIYNMHDQTNYWLLMVSHKNVGFATLM